MRQPTLKKLLAEIPKAELQRCYLHWFPGEDLLSSKDRLRTELVGAMTDFHRVRERFNSLSRAQQAFLSSLLLRENSFAATVDEVRNGKHGRAIEDYEVEPVLKSLQEAGYIVRLARRQPTDGEVFSIPDELARALKCTVSVEERTPLQMLSFSASDGTFQATRDGAVGTDSADPLTARIDGIEDRALRVLAETALRDCGGILTLSDCERVGKEEESQESVDVDASAGLANPAWREELERRGVGTIGVISLKDYGLDLEEQALCIYQEHVYEHGRRQAANGFVDNDREVAVSVDLLIDLDRLADLLQKEPDYLTREGRVYKRVEEKLGPKLVISHYQEFIDRAPVQHLCELARKLRLCERDGQRHAFDPTRRRAWTSLPLLKKLELVFDLYWVDERESRWSFHQQALRERLLEELKSVGPGDWLVAKPFLSAIVAGYLCDLDKRGVRRTYEQLLQDDFRHQKLVVPVRALYQDLSYWFFHRIGLLGLVDVGFRDGSFYSFRLSRLGRRFFGLDSMPEISDSPRLLVNADFELLVYPEAPEEWNWIVSQFSERRGSDYVKSYTVSRESLKHALARGWEYKKVVDFLEQNAFGSVPPNVVFSIREWMQGVEFVRKRRVLMLRSQTKVGADRLGEILTQREIGYERLAEAILIVQGLKNEQTIKALHNEFLDWGLIVE